ncbi:MAG TPA: response regulator [Paludibaculum sp.]
MEPVQEPETTTILIAEDDARIRDLIGRILEKLGYRLLMAQDGKEAAEIAAAHDGPIDLLLSDVMMPELDGPHLAAIVQDARPDIRLIFMSGYSNGLLKMLDRNCLFIQKPFHPGTLIEAVRSTLAKPLRRTHLLADPWAGGHATA